MCEHASFASADVDHQRFHRVRYTPPSGAASLGRTGACSHEQPSTTQLFPLLQRLQRAVLLHRDHNRRDVTEAD